MVSSLFKKGFTRKILKNIKETKKIKEVAVLRNGYAFKNSKYDDKGKYNIVTISNVTGEQFISTKFKNHYDNLPTDIQPYQILKDKDILISMTGNVGRVSMNKGNNNLLNQRVGILELKNNVDKDFLFNAINNEIFEKCMINCGQGAAQLNISKNDIENYKIPFTNIKNQKRISTLLNSISILINLENNKLNKLQELKKGLMQKMFV